MSGQSGEPTLPPAALSITANNFGEAGLDSALEIVEAAWLVDAELAPQTRIKFVRQLRSFNRFATARGVTSIAAVDHKIVTDYLLSDSRSRRRGAAPTPPSHDTARNRRAAVRAFFRTAQQLGLAPDDPTANIVISRREFDEVQTLRPLTDGEAALVRKFSEHDYPTRHAATAALLLAGAHTSEVGRIRIQDFDSSAHRVSAPGSARLRARQLPLDRWARRVIYERIERLSGRGAASDQPICTKTGGTDTQLRSRIFVTVSEIITRAGIADTPGVAPSSLTAYAGRRALEDSGRIEQAARLIGYDSLDETAALIGFDWAVEARV